MSAGHKDYSDGQINNLLGDLTRPTKEVEDTEHVVPLVIRYLQNERSERSATIHSLPMQIISDHTERFALRNK